MSCCLRLLWEGLRDAGSHQPRQQFRAKKGQDELAVDIAKQKLEFDKQKN
jgi:hypothetical protein